MELELHDFVRAKDAYDMSVDEKIASQVPRCCRCVGRCRVANGVVTFRAPRTHAHPAPERDARDTWRAGGQEGAR